MDSFLHQLPDHRQKVILIDGWKDIRAAKTAVSLLRYQRNSVCAIFDRANSGKTAGDVVGIGDSIPVIGSLEEIPGPLQADSIYLGLAAPGGGIPEAWIPILEDSLARHLDIVSGLHTRIGSLPELKSAAARSGSRIFDLRRCEFHQVAKLPELSPRQRRILTVGSDCNVGKMTTALEMHAAAAAEGVRSGFVATGQTGIMIHGSGIAVDAIVSDFISGASEQLILAQPDPEVLWIEGQGSLTQPIFSAVTLGLLHGSRPTDLILCHDWSRIVHRHTQIPIPPLAFIRDLYENLCRPVHPAKVIALSIASHVLDEYEWNTVRHEMQNRLQVPVFDPIRDRSLPPLWA